MPYAVICLVRLAQVMGTTVEALVYESPSPTRVAAEIPARDAGALALGARGAPAEVRDGSSGL